MVMEGVIDCIMHSSNKKITPSSSTSEKTLSTFPKEADVDYSKLWVILEGSDPENPWWLEIERPMIPSCEWKSDNKNLKIGHERVRVTIELLPEKR